MVLASMLVTTDADFDRHKNTGTASDVECRPGGIGLLAGYTADYAAKQTADGPEHRIEHARDGAEFAA